MKSEHVLHDLKDLEYGDFGEPLARENLGEQLRRQANAQLKSADQFVQANPYAAVGIALGAGLLLAYLLKRD